MAEKNIRHRRLYLCSVVYAPLSAIIGGGTGFIVAGLFYGMWLVSDPASVWESYHFWYAVTGLGALAGLVGGLCFSLLFFRQNIGEHVFVKSLLYSLVSLVAAAVVYGIVINKYKSIFLVGYQVLFFMFIAFIPWFFIGLLALLLRGRIMRA